MGQRPHTAHRLLALAVVAAMAPSAAVAWAPQTQLLIGHNAASIAPPDLARQIERHEKAFRRGVLAPFETTSAAAHEQNPSGDGELAASIQRAVDRAVDRIRTHQPFDDVVFHLGMVSHFVADASNPLSSSDDDPRESTYLVDYARYVESASLRFPLVFYAEGRDLTGEADLRSLVEIALRRSRGLYPLIGREYDRIGRIDGPALFDDRSTAFGVASVAVSHAVSDVAAVLRYVWLEAGGGDTRRLGLTRPQSPPLPTDSTR